MKGKAKVNASMPKHPYMEETLDELYGKGSLKKIRSHHMSSANKIAQDDEKRMKKNPNAAHRVNNPYADDAIRHHMSKVRKADRLQKKMNEEETMEEGRMPPSVIAHKQKLASMSDKEFAEKHGHKSEKQLRDMGARHGYGFDKATKTGSDHYVKRAASKQIDEKAPSGAKYERMVKHIKAGYAKDGLTAKEKGIAFATAWKAKNREKLKEKVEFDPSTETPRNMEEAMGSVKKVSPLKRFKTKANTVVRRGLGKERDTQTVLVTNKGDPRAAAGGGVRRIPKSKYNPSKHNLASE
jgi:hypothetical protein